MDVGRVSPSYHQSAARRGAVRPLSSVAVEQGRAMNPLSLSENRSQTNHEPLRKREESRAGPWLSLTAVTQPGASGRGRERALLTRDYSQGLGDLQDTLYILHCTPSWSTVRQDPGLTMDITLSNKIQVKHHKLHGHIVRKTFCTNIDG